MSKVNESLKDFWSRCSMRLDRTIQSSFLKQVAMLVAVNAAVLLICFLIWGLSRGEWNLWMVYNNYIDTGNQAGAGNSERWIAVITSVFGSFLFGCLLISTLSNIIERRIDRYRSGLVRYRHSRHSVIIGADPMLDELVSQLLHTSSEQDIVILTTKDTDQVRRHLTAGLSPEDSRRIFICYGTRDSGKDLESIHISLADKVYILGESGEIDDIEYFHDSLNVDCLYKIGRICLDSGRTDKLKCWMSMEYRTTFNVFQFSDIPPGHKAIIDLHPFNFYEDWARKVLVLNRFGDKKYKPLDYNGIISYESDSYVHLVIIGMSKMGEAMAIEAAHIAHFPNFIRDRSKKTRITFIDREARACADEFMQTFPYLFDLSCSTFIDTEADTVQIRKPSGEYSHLGEDFLDIEWQFVQGRIESEPVRRLLCSWAEDNRAQMTVAVCLNLTHQSIATAMYLPDCIRDRAIPVLVQQRITPSIIDNISQQHYANLQAFGMISGSMTLDDSIETYAKRVNYVYSNIQDSADIDEAIEKGSPETVGACWRTLTETRPVAKQWSNIYNACSIPTKLRSIGILDINCIETLTEEQYSLLAEVEHNRWNIEELLLGYRPVTAAEEHFVSTSPTPEVMNSRKKSLKASFIHYDIRDYSLLAPSVQVNDIAISKYIPYIIRGIPGTRTKNN